MAKSNPSTGASAGRGKQQQQAGASKGKGGGAGGGGGGGGATARGGGGSAQGAGGRGGQARGGAGGGAVWKPQQKQGERLTGTPDEHYNLVSVLYHSLKGAQIYAQYVQDAEEAGDTQLASFLRQVQGEEQGRAERAKSLLVGRLGGSAGRTGDEEE